MRNTLSESNPARQKSTSVEADKVQVAQSAEVEPRDGQAEGVWPCFSSASGGAFSSYPA